MNILLLTTGGTIASVEDNGVIDVKQHTRLLILEKYRQLDNVTHFDVVSPVNILSENISKEDYKAIVTALCNVQFENYDGVIITHGSDTLAYTAALVSLLFGDINKPIAVVAADKPLGDVRSNGLDNFICAVEIIKQNMCGVYVPYRNADGVTYIHHAANLLESAVFSDDFYSVGGACAVYENGAITMRECDATPQKALDIDFSKLSFDSKVLQINPYPDIDYSCYNISDIKAVLHRSFHAGTLCCQYDDHSLLPFIKRCKNEGVDFYVCGVKSGKADYASLKKAIDAGAKVLYDMSPACAYIKLLIEGK